jgi:hypothetical protein
MVGGEECGELGVGTAQRAGDVEDVAGACSGAAERTAGGCGADEDNVGEDEVGGGLRGIAAGERRIVLASEGAEAGEEAFDPVLPTGGSKHLGGEREREEGGEGRGSHGGKVTESSGEAAMPDGGGGV